MKKTRRCSAYSRLFALLGLLCSSLSFSQDEPSVGPRIISPRNGTIVRPRQSVKVKVVCDSEPGQLLVTGDDPLNACSPDRVSHECSIRIPRDTAPGRYDVWVSVVRKEGADGLMS